MIYYHPSKAYTNNSSQSSNSDLKNMENILNDEKLSNISLNITEKDIIEEISKPKKVFFDDKNI